MLARNQQGLVSVGKENARPNVSGAQGKSLSAKNQKSASMCDEQADNSNGPKYGSKRVHHVVSGCQKSEKPTVIIQRPQHPEPSKTKSKGKGSSQQGNFSGDSEMALLDKSKPDDNKEEGKKEINPIVHPSMAEKNEELVMGTPIEEEPPDK